MATFPSPLSQNASIHDGGGASSGCASSALLGKRPGNSDSFAAAERMAYPNYVRFATSLRHWKKSILTVYVDPVGDDRPADEILTQVARGSALWNDRLGPNLDLQMTDNPRGADVKISFVKPGTLPGDAIGRTDVTYKLADQTLTHATIRVNRGLSDAELMQVSAHELGHALGIQGHSPDKHDLMYAYAHLPAMITTRDYNTMALSYNLINDGSETMSDSAGDFDAANINADEQDDNATGE